MKNTEISRILGGLWRNITEEEKRPHIEQEERERKKYKTDMIKWRKDQEAKEKILKETKRHHDELFQLSSQQTIQDTTQCAEKQCSFEGKRISCDEYPKNEVCNSCTNTSQENLSSSNDMVQFPQIMSSSETIYPQQNNLHHLYDSECFDHHEREQNCDTPSNFDPSIWHEGARFHDQQNDVHLKVEDCKLSDAFLSTDIYEANAFEPVPIANIDLGRY